MTDDMVAALAVLALAAAAAAGLVVSLLPTVG
jgi:hypothetical protein